MSAVSSSVQMPVRRAFPLIERLPAEIFEEIVKEFLDWQAAMRLRLGSRDLLASNCCPSSSPLFGKEASLTSFLKSAQVPASLKNHLRINFMLTPEQVERVAGLNPNLTQVEPFRRDQLPPLSISALLGKCPNLQGIDLSSIELTEEIFEALAQCTHITQCKIKSHQLSDRLLGIMQTWPLEELEVVPNFKGDVPALSDQSLAFEHLRKLTLWGILPDQVLSKVIGACSVLKDLHLTNDSDDSDQHSIYDYSGNLSFLDKPELQGTLRTLCISSGFGIPDEEIARIQACRNLTSLSLETCSMKEKTFQPLAQNLQQLRSLSIIPHYQGSLSFPPTGTCPKLTHLELTQGQGVNPSNFLEFAQNFPQISDLNIDCQSLSIQDLIAILPHFAQLRALALVNLCQGKQDPIDCLEGLQIPGFPELAQRIEAIKDHQITTGSRWERDQWRYLRTELFADVLFEVVKNNKFLQKFTFRNPVGPVLNEKALEKWKKAGIEFNQF